MRIHNAITKPPITCRIDMHIDAVARLMAEYGGDSVLIVDKSGRLAGVVTERQVRIAELMRPSGDTPIIDILDSQIFSCRAEDRIESAIALMRDLHVGRMAVTDADGRPLGVLSLADLAWAIERGRTSGRSPQPWVKRRVAPSAIV
jgi:CBS domain-containing protein